MIQKTLYRTLMLFDRLYKHLYPNDKSAVIQSILNDHSATEMDLSDFVEARGNEALKEIYVIINNFYVSRLSDLIAEGNDEEISKLKYLQILTVDIKNTLNTNSNTNG